MGLMTYDYQAQMPTRALYEVALTRRDGSATVARVRAASSEAAAKTFRTRRMAAKWGFRVVGVVRL